MLRNPSLSRGARRLGIALLACSIGALGACSETLAPPDEDGGAGEAGQRRIALVSRPATTDTVGASHDQALVVEVRDSAGRRVSGKVVRFQVLPHGDTTRVWQSQLAVCSLGMVTCPVTGPTIALDTTGVDGRAAVAVRWSTVAGNARVRVHVPEYGVADTVPFTVTAGGAADVDFTVRDAAVRNGQPLTVTARVTDRYGNPRADAPRYSSLGVVTVDSASGVVGTAGFGVGRVVARFGAFADTARVSVVPDGYVVAYRTWPQPALLSMRLDGTAARVITPVSGHTTALPSWIPGTWKVLYEENDGGHHLRVVDSAGAVSSLPLGFPGGTGAVQPQPSGDGQAAYFQGLTPDNAGIWRLVFGGAGATLVQGASTPGASWPSVARDGARIAYRLGGQLYIATLPDGAAVATGIYTGDFYRWSHDGAKVYYHGTGGLRSYTVAGGATASIPGTSGFALGFDVSGDGEWVVGSVDGRLTIVRIADGLRIPLAREGSPLYQPSWRR